MLLESFIIIMQQTLIHLPLIIGAYISIALMKVPDLSLESAYVFGALLAAKTVVFLHGMPLIITVPCTLFASLLGGAFVGLTSSLLTQKAQLPHLLSSIITFGIFHGVNQLVAASYISLSPYINQLAIINIIPRHPELIMLFLICTILFIIMYAFLNTQLGYSFALYGVNPHFFSHYNISTVYVFIVGIVISNALAGLGGFLFAQSNGFAEINMGLGKALLCITMLILGKALYYNKTNIYRPTMIYISILGGISYFIIQYTLLKVGFNLKYFTMIHSLLVLVILITAHKKQRLKRGIDHLGV